jgi:hypothetical protein
MRRGTRLCALRLLFMAVVRLASAALHYAACPDDAVDENGHPQVQCGREPPCVRYSYLNKERCSGQLRNDSGWPTADAHVPRETGWATAADLLGTHMRNKTLLVVGDSITHGWYAGFLCEVVRSGLTLVDDMQHPRLRALRHAVEATPGWDRVPVEEVYVVETDTVISYKGYGMASPADTAAILNISDVLLVNYGVHYHDLPTYEADMALHFEALGDFNRQPCKAAVFREVSMQAFANTGVWTPGADKATEMCSAVPPEVAAESLIAQQNAVVHRLGAQRRVPVLPFYNFTLARWDSFEEKYCEIVQRKAGNPAPCLDCSHLCMSPTLYARMVHEWHQLLQGGPSAELCT